MKPMSEEAWTAFLNQGTRTGKLAVNLPSGRPTVTPVWFVLEDDGKLRMTTGGASAKVRALRADPRACLLVDLEEPPYAFVKVDATTAVIDDDPALCLRIATAVGGRYMGPERAEEFGRRNGGDGQVVLEFTPTKVTAAGDVAG
ncbi:MAG: PPOX class F420-dependent oxidoreductase [Actinomycetota bacterium]